MSDDPNRGEAPAPLPMEIRLGVFYDRLMAAPPVSTQRDAWRLLARLLHDVEDEFSGIPASTRPSLMSDGRMYPPQDDMIRPVSGHDTVAVGTTTGHRVYVATNGAIEIRRRDGTLELRKLGADGCEVWPPGETPFPPKETKHER